MKAIHHTLKCGINAVLVPCEAQSVAFGVFVISGSRGEKPADAGISHFIEHMLFKGTPTRKAIDITRAIEGSGGNFNAFTSEETTCFFAHMPDDCLGEAVEILSDMYLNASFPADEFITEKGVILEEIKMYADDPDSVAEENLQRLVFPRNAIGTPVAGSEQTVSKMTPERLRAYMKSHYLASNTVLAVAGSFDIEKTIALLEQKFAPSLVRRGRKPAFKKVDFSIPQVDEIRTSRDIAQVKVAIGYRTFGLDDDRRYAMNILDALLGKGMSSRLFQEVREKRGLSYNISSMWHSFTDSGMFTISAGLSAANMAKMMDTIDRELEKIATRKVPSAELERTKRFLTGNFKLGHEKVLAKLLFHGGYFMAYGKTGDTDVELERIRAVTAEDVRSLAAEIFAGGNRSVSWVMPR
ncbi:MAG: insulinase family protein [Kiritimatiellae bacterium]|nr:insulinase family protein [Kiritimatiellia bacterium]